MSFGWITHDDLIKWKHLPRYWPFVRGIQRSPVNSLPKGQWRGALMFSLICIWINGLENNREAGDLRRHRAHYDVIVVLYYTALWVGIQSSKTHLKLNIRWVNRLFSNFYKGHFVHNFKTIRQLKKVCGQRRFRALRWRHNGRDGVSNHQLYDCLLNRLFRRRSKKTPKLRVTDLCARNSPVTKG